MSEAYDQNDQGPIVVLHVSGGNHVVPDCVVRSRLHCMVVTVVQSGSIGNVRKAKMGGL